MITEFAFKPDFERANARLDAFWACSLLDRAAVSITLSKGTPKPLPKRDHASWEEYWLDIEYRSEQMIRRAENTLYLAEALPVLWPDMGPEIYSALCGCPYLYGQDTTWTEPCVFDWGRDMPKARLNIEHPLLKKLDAFTDLLLERAQSRYIVGLTDLHSGGDHLAALRDPQQLCLDMIERPEKIIEKLNESEAEYFGLYDHFYDKLKSAGMPITSWLPLVCEGRYYIPSNDFSCMISRQMFEDVFLPGIARECDFYERSIYHLDGPGALRHLDALLDIPSLGAVQWVFGAGNEGFARWVPVYQKIQSAGKALVIVGMELSELPLLYETLRPEGLFIGYIGGIGDLDTANAVLKSIERWR